MTAREDPERLAALGQGGEGPRQADSHQNGEGPRLAALGQGGEGPERLARQVVELARAQVLAANHLLAPAVGRLELQAGTYGFPLASGSRILGFDPQRVLAGFREARRPPTHDLLHCVLHCVLLHPFANVLAAERLATAAPLAAVSSVPGSLVACPPAADPFATDSSVPGSLAAAPSAFSPPAAAEPRATHRLWNLACDIAVERLVADALGPRGGRRGHEMAAALALVEGSCGRVVSAQKVCRLLQAGEWEAHLASWEALFAADDHCQWNMAVPSAGGSPDSSQGFDEDAQPGAQGKPGDIQGAKVGREVDVAGAGDPEEWRRIARRMKVAFETQREEGKNAGMLVEEIERAMRRPVDYAAWLRQFAASGEVLRLSDDEFDPVFYTYGLRRYGNLPLVEPLEQREERRVREFVIVIDTSQSVSGEAVRRFVDETYTVLSSSDAFFERVNVHIVQCDAKVQRDDVVTSLAQLEEWGRDLQLLGFGGTDFRPAFDYIDQLVEQGEFENLGGVVYFTDGWGVYPARRPDYKVAFAFYDDDHRADEVPPWAVQVVLDQLP